MNLREMVAAIAAVGLVSDFLLPAALWRNFKTEVRGRGGAWLAVGGLGMTSADSIAVSAEASLPGPVDSMRFSSWGISKAGLGDALNDYYQSLYKNGVVKPQRLLAHSMGWVESLVGMQDCLERGRYVPPLASAVAISSPQTFADAWKPGIVNAIGNFRYRGGILSKGLLEFIFAFRSERFAASALGRSLLRGARQSYHDCSPRLWSSQVQLLVREAPKLNPELFRRAGVISPDTTVYMCTDPDDQTVVSARAKRSVRRFVEAASGRLRDISLPASGHANVEAACASLAPLLKV